ncbi:MAG: bifunctional nicotinamidase/pyrazinamidase [Bacteroidia bacterium]|nr:bifunctional nicotinamidase/pyrazinamidase [Bacteroidia bacterium]
MRALILVDIQNDFLPGGALEVPQGDKILNVVNLLQPLFPLVVATQDWHPADHGSFAANHAGKSPGELIDLFGLTQVLWPVHCVQGSKGAEFSDQLHTSAIKKVFVKGTDSSIDSYSGFFDNGHRKATGLEDYLRDQQVEEVYVVGLAADYCVKFTALDAKASGFRTFVIEDATRGVNLSQYDTRDAFFEMEAAGIHLINSQDVIQMMESQEE